MIILDTNIISELGKQSPDRAVATWFGGLTDDDVFLTSITRAEALVGLFCLPDGSRRRELEASTFKLLDETFGAKTLVFDQWSAHHYAMILAERKVRGRPIHPCDAMIAAIARSRGAALATRDVRDFDGCGLDLINPFDLSGTWRRTVSEPVQRYCYRGFRRIDEQCSTVTSQYRTN
ncbi:type II toxin-antitoxin system VapC family toxin [Bacillus sp. NP157]|nr:type II toxin-antitoxin system VapC family toxin [Bacillus sp. NP157]